MSELSPERLYIRDSGCDSDLNHLKHLSRYYFSSQFIQKGPILDCACGSGYGSKILAKKGGHILGVDISLDAIKYAEDYNNSDNIKYESRSIQSLEFDNDTFEAVVSLETLEHIPKMDMIEFLKKAQKWVAPGGVFIGSSPMLRYSEGLPFITNPYHINELPREELLEIVSQSFLGCKIYFFHQEIDSFTILDKEKTGFCLFVVRKI